MRVRVVFTGVPFGRAGGLVAPAPATSGWDQMAVSWPAQAVAVVATVRATVVAVATMRRAMRVRKVGMEFPLWFVPVPVGRRVRCRLL